MYTALRFQTKVTWLVIMKNKNILITIFLLQFAIVQCISRSELINKALDVTQQHYDPQLVTAVVWGQDDEDDVTTFLKIYTANVVVAPIYNNKSIIQSYIKLRYTQVICCTTNKEEFKEFIQVIGKMVRIPIRTILIMTEDITDTDMNALTRTAWDNDLSDLVIVSIKMNKVVLSSYFPYNGGKCDDTTPVVLSPDSNAFPNKFNNLHNCSIKTFVAMNKPMLEYTEEKGRLKNITGIEWDIFKVIVKKLNASVNIMILENDPLAYLMNKTVEIGANYAFVNEMRYSLLQTSLVHHSIEIIWLGPGRRPVKQWYRIVLPLMSKFIYALIVTFFIFVVVVDVIQKTKLFKTIRRQSVLFKSFIIFIGVNVKLDAKSI